VTTGDQFRQVLRRGRKTRCQGGLIAVNTGANDVDIRFGFVVPKAVGGAVVRNRVKRRLRAAALSLVDCGVVADVVVRADSGSEGVTVAQWTEDLSKALERERSR
jgi:ribonuclease P protein component